MASTKQILEDLLKRINPILIVAPPRTASTLLARVIFHNSHIENYNHEPCDKYCHNSEGLKSIVKEIKDNPAELIKEMTFQIGNPEIFTTFFELARKPIIFQVKHPFLSIESRIRMVLKNIALLDESRSWRLKINQAISSKNYTDLDDILSEEIFPLKYIGWNDLEEQILYCKNNNLDFIITDAYDMSSSPLDFTKTLCDSLGLDFEEGMVNWRECGKFSVGGLPEQNHWYDKVIKSNGILPPQKVNIGINHFPKRFRPEVTKALNIYKELNEDSSRLEI
jgi:hypothetical protein